MKTSRISGVLKSLASAKASGKLNVILTIPQGVIDATTKGPVKASVVSSSKTGETIVKTEFGNLRLFSSIPLKDGDGLLLYSKGFGNNLALRVLPVGQNTHTQAVSMITNELPTGEQTYAVFKMPNQLKALKDSLTTEVKAPAYYPNLKGVENQNTKQLYNDPTSGSIIAFLSYVFSEKFDKNLRKSKPEFIPDATHPDFAKQVARFISTFSSIEDVYKLTDTGKLDPKLKVDLINVAQTNVQLQGENWKMSIVPIFTGDRHIVARFMSRKVEEHEEPESVPSKRFFVDLTTDEHGKILVDGFVNYPDGNATAKLIIKSENRFQDWLEDEIMKAAQRASQSTGIPTNVTFHKLQKSDPDPFSDILQDYYKGKLNLLMV